MHLLRVKRAVLILKKMLSFLVHNLVVQYPAIFTVTKVEHLQTIPLSVQQYTYTCKHLQLR